MPTKKMVLPGLILGAVVALAPLLAARAQAPTQAPSESSLPARPSYLRLGLGTSYDNIGYYRCVRLSLEYAPMLSRRVGLASRLAGAAGKPWGSGLETQLPNQNYKAAYLEQEVVFYPFGNDRRLNLGVGGGGFAGHYWRNGYSSFQGVNGRVTKYELASKQGGHAGYLFSLNLDVALGQSHRWRLGAKSTVQNGLGGNTTTPTHNLTLARRL